jgi:hypothetical protein
VELGSYGSQKLRCCRSEITTEAIYFRRR